MKRLIILAVALLPMLSTAQGIKFEKGDWASVLAKAKKGDKIIMTDFYTTWCGPCKMMVKNIFPLKNVGDFYNTNFVNYKIDAEKGEGIALAKKYNVKAFPTYIFTDGDGNFLHQAVGAFSAEEFISHGKTALDPSKQLKNLLKEDKAISKADMPAHLRKLNKERLPYDEKYQAYIKSLSDKELYTKDTYDLMTKLGGFGASGFTYDFLLKNRNQFAKAVGEKAVNDYFYGKLLLKAYDNERKTGSLKPVLDEVKALGFDFADRIEDKTKLSAAMYEGKGHDEFVDNARLYIKKYIPNDPAGIYSDVFIEAVKFFYSTPKVKAFALELADQLIAKNYKASSVNAHLGMETAKEGLSGLEKGLEYYKEADRIAKANKEDVDYSQSIGYISERIAILKKGDYTYNGKGFDKYNGMTINLSHSNPTTIGDFIETEKVTITDGKFTLSGNVKELMRAVWGIYKGDKFITKGYIVLEPGTYPMIMDADGDVMLDKTTFNYYVYNSWKTSGDYKAANKAVKDYMARPDYDISNPEQRKKFFELSNAVGEIKKNYLVSAFYRNPDPIVKALAVMEGGLYHDRGEDKSGSERLAYLEKIAPDNYLVKTMRYGVERAKEMANMRSTVDVGNKAKMFTSKDHDGNTVDLAKVLKKNNYVLVEFWASWCSPCRGAIPHLKEAYNKYKKKGFEIVSFSIDHKRDAWDKAFKEEGIPWIDLSDVIGRKSPIAEMYGVTGVPASYLIDKEGNILGAEMRGDKLDETLKKVFGF